MSQQDYTIDNATGAAVRADLNATLQAIVSANSGTSEPSTMFAYQIWADTTANKLKIRNGANNAWYEVGSLDAANLGLMLASFFPNINANVTASDEELNVLDGFTGDTADLTYAKDLKATGVTASEFDTLDGVTSSIQTQINAKAPTAGSSSQTFSVATPTSSSHATTKSYVDAIETTTGKVFTTSGSWTVPAGVTKIVVTGCGGGGGGSRYSTSSFCTQAAGGAGAGGIINYPFTVTPGQSISVTIGAGGAGTTTSGNGTGATGGSTTFSGAGISTVTLSGGGASQGSSSTGGTCSGVNGYLVGGNGTNSAGGAALALGNPSAVCVNTSSGGQVGMFGKASNGAGGGAAADATGYGCGGGGAGDWAASRASDGSQGILIIETAS